jgi:hypothetical protein
MSSYKKRRPPRRQPRQRRQKKFTPNSDVANISTAANEQWEDKNGTEHKNIDWFQIQVCGSLVKFAATLKARTPVIVECKIKPETYTPGGFGLPPYLRIRELRCFWFFGHAFTCLLSRACGF